MISDDRLVATLPRRQKQAEKKGTANKKNWGVLFLFAVFLFFFACFCLRGSVATPSWYQTIMISYYHHSIKWPWFFGLVAAMSWQQLPATQAITNPSQRRKPKHNSKNKCTCVLVWFGFVMACFARGVLPGLCGFLVSEHHDIWVSDSYDLWLP